jgi:hypothetical protein
MPAQVRWTPSEIVQLLRASTESAAIEVRALGRSSTIRPAPGEWCANEVIGHLIEADRRGFGGRIRTILELDRPILASWDQPAVAAARHDDARDAEELLAELESGRETEFAFIAGLDKAALARTGIHRKVGELRVSDILHEWVHHDREHLAQLQAITQVLVRPFMGNARKFSDPKA